MCGLVGVAGKITADSLKAFKQLLIVDQLRGAHSTGIAAIEDGEAEVFKRAVVPTDLLELKPTNKLLTVNKDVIIGHNRYATSGGIDHATAHPFQHGDITLVHNGTLRSRNGLLKSTEFKVDSENVCYTLSQKEPLEVLEEVNGAFVFIWHDARDNSLHFARNSERELYIANTGSQIYWASEKEMLEWILVRNNINIKEIYILPTEQHWYFKMDDERFSVEDFTEYTPSYTPYKYNPPSTVKTVAQLGYKYDQEVEFIVTSHVKNAQRSTYNLEGFLADEPDQSIKVFQVPLTQLKLVKDFPDPDYSYKARITTAGSGDALILSAHTIKATLVKKHQTSYTEQGGHLEEDDGGVVIIDGAPFLEHEIKDICNTGCAWCGSPFTREDLAFVKVDDDENVYHPLCLQAYDEMLEAY